MNKKNRRKLEDFIKDETGKVSKKHILKIGLGTISAMGLMEFMSQSVHAAQQITDTPTDECAPLHSSY